MNLIEREGTSSPTPIGGFFCSPDRLSYQQLHFDDVLSCIEDPFRYPYDKAIYYAAFNPNSRNMNGISF